MISVKFLKSKSFGHCVMSKKWKGNINTKMAKAEIRLFASIYQN